MADDLSTPSFVTVLERGKAYIAGQTIPLEICPTKGTCICGFEMSEFVVTIEEWIGVAAWANRNGYSLPHAQWGYQDQENKNRPITGICWCDAVLWCNAASEAEGLAPAYYDSNGYLLKNFDGYEDLSDYWPEIKTDYKSNGYRLPTISEWEIAARGGDPSAPDWNYKFSGDNDLAEVGWYGGDDGDGNADDIMDVGQLNPNRLGLYDMCGNVMEMCDGNQYAGGAWSSPEDECAILYAATASGDDPCAGEDYVGFRVVRTLEIQTEAEALNMVNVASMLLNRVPENLRTEKVCLAAVKKGEKAWNFVPEALKARVEALLQSGGAPAAEPKQEAAVPPPLPTAPAWQGLPPVQYYAGLNGQQAGPFGWSELDGLVKKGDINKQTLVWKVGFAGWTAAGEVAELKVLWG